jgi:hypothetical protein
MTDLIKRLRSPLPKYVNFSGQVHVEENKLLAERAEAADRIEELVKERKALAMRDAGYDVYAALEAKLAKAMEALGNIARQKKTEQIEAEGETEFSDFEGAYDMCIDVARAAWAELEGEERDEQ